MPVVTRISCASVRRDRSDSEYVNVGIDHDRHLITTSSFFFWSFNFLFLSIIFRKVWMTHIYEGIVGRAQLNIASGVWVTQCHSSDATNLNAFDVVLHGVNQPTGYLPGRTYGLCGMWTCCSVIRYTLLSSVVISVCACKIKRLLLWHFYEGHIPFCRTYFNCLKYSFLIAEISSRSRVRG